MSAAQQAGPNEADPNSGAVRLRPADSGRCRRRIHLEHDPDADRDARRLPAPGLQLRYDLLAHHRDEVRSALAARLPLDEAWQPGDSARPAAIWLASLRSDTRRATPELLIRSVDGGYLPIVVRGHRTTDPGSGARLMRLDLVGSKDFSYPARSTSKKLRSHHADRLALAHIYRLLQELGIAAGDSFGGVIGRGGPAGDADWDDGSVVAWHDLRSVLPDYDTAFADRLAVARAAAARQPALAQPSKIAECRRCPWWTVCGPQLEAAHDISLLVSGQDVTELRRRGIANYRAVAKMTPADVAALPVTTVPADEIRARAQAMTAGAPMVRRRDRVDPVRADVELDVDMESYSDDGAYLWGTYLTGDIPDGFSRGYTPFVTWSDLASPAAAANFVEFWRYLTALRDECRQAGLSCAAYCYSHAAEERWLYGTPARFPDAPGMPSRREITAFCESGQWVDLYQEVKRCFIVPGSMKLKRVAHIAGFSWRDPEPGGENSMAWYRVAAGLDAGGVGDTADASEISSEVGANQQRILRYNEDDVIATLRLRQWMSDGAQKMPTVAQLNATVGNR